MCLGGEMADAGDLKSPALRGVWVRLPPRAPNSSLIFAANAALLEGNPRLTYDLSAMANSPQGVKRPATYWIGEAAGWLLKHVVTGLSATGVTPNMFTYLALAVNGWAAALFATGRFRGAAAVLFLAGFLDMADGQVARRVGRVTAFGAFLDSTLDRYSDLGLYMGLVVYYTLIGRPFYMALAAVAMASSFMVSYARARAESLIPICKVGFMERPERLGLLIIGGAFNFMGAALWAFLGVYKVTWFNWIVF